MMASFFVFSRKGQSGERRLVFRGDQSCRCARGKKGEKKREKEETQGKKKLGEGVAKAWKDICVVKACPILTTEI